MSYDEIDREASFAGGAPPAQGTAVRTRAAAADRLPMDASAAPG